MFLTRWFCSSKVRLQLLRRLPRAPGAPGRSGGAWDPIRGLRSGPPAGRPLGHPRCFLYVTTWQKYLSTSPSSVTPGNAPNLSVTSWDNSGEKGQPAGHREGQCLWGQEVWRHPGNDGEVLTPQKSGSRPREPCRERSAQGSAVLCLGGCSCLKHMPPGQEQWQHRS